MLFRLASVYHPHVLIWLLPKIAPLPTLNTQRRNPLTLMYIRRQLSIVHPRYLGGRWRRPTHGILMVYRGEGGLPPLYISFLGMTGRRWESDWVSKVGLGFCLPEIPYPSSEIQGVLLKVIRPPGFWWVRYPPRRAKY